MNDAIAVTRKELRAWFQSPVAFIFLGVFLVMTLFGFFTLQRFFARNIADVRPLFEMFPVLLIFLVSAITMRQWADERRTGTLEVLLTLPIRTRDLVIGKFVAGMVLLSVGLALTLPLVITVSMLGDLDWGPVVGGYAGALLLASVYLALGLCVSSRTDNQVVSLMATLVFGGLLYLVGSEALLAFFDTRTAEALRALGTGSRFESIERGVIDLRDLVYYLGLTTFFLVLNGAFLELARMDPGSPGGRARRGFVASVVALVGLNVLAANAWLAPVDAIRVDLTETGEYSISEVTTDTLQTLDEPLRITGLFSERTHPLLAPLVPRIRDLLAEYEVHGDGRVEVTFHDPNTDEDLEQELAQEYGIRSVPFRISDRYQESVVNSYFHLLVEYGDEYRTLSFEDLIEVDASEDDIDVRLRNLEYDLTRTIRRVTQEFQSAETLLAGFDEPVRLTAYISKEHLPEDLAESASRIRSAAAELTEQAGDSLVFEEVDPTGDTALQERLYENHGMQPYALDLLGRETFYFHLLLEMGDQSELVHPAGDATEADVLEAIEAAIKRATPGQLTTVALYTRTPEAPPRDPRMPAQYQPPAPQPDYQLVPSYLEEEYEVVEADLSSGPLDETVDVLVLAKPGALDETQLYTVDQFLMRGGRVIVLAGSWFIELDSSGMKPTAQDEALLEALSTWGVNVDEAMVLDTRNASFPIPVQERRGAFVMERIELMPYPFFPDVRQEGLNREHPALSGLTNVTVPWSSPLDVAEDVEGVTHAVMLESSSESWLDDSGEIDPDFETWPEEGFGPSGTQGSRVLGVTLQGTFPSHFAGESPPETEGDSTIQWTQTLDRALPDARLAVIGSAEFTSDLMLQLSRQVTGEVHRGNLQLLRNLVDWAVEDTDLLGIRSAGAFARTLRPLHEDERRNWEIGNYVLVLLALVVVWIVPRQRRRSIKPIPLDGRERK